MKFLKYFNLFVLTFSIGLLGCGEEEKPLKDVIQITWSVSEISNVGVNGATVDGTVSYDGENLKSRGLGFVWSTSSQPEVADSIRQSWSSSSSLTTLIASPTPIFVEITNLEMDTRYFVRSYFVHEDESLVYGRESSFTTFTNDSWYEESVYPGELTDYSTGFVIDNMIYIGLGFSLNSPSAILEWFAYDLEQNKWSEKMSIPGSVGVSGGDFSIGDKGYVLSDDSGLVWEYDATNDRWTQKTDFPNASGISLPLSIALNGKGYIGGGLGSNGNRFWEFDPSDDSQGMDKHGNPMGRWTEKASYTGGEMFGPYGFTIDNQIYIYNQYALRDGNGEFIREAKEFWAYNPSSDLWIKKLDFPGEISLSERKVALSIDGLGYIGGGGFAELWSYNPDMDEWMRQNDAPIIESAGADISFSTNNHGYFLSDREILFKYVP